MSKMYISGPITGLGREYAEKQFEAAERAVALETSYTPVNPMRINTYSNKNTWEDNLRFDIVLLMQCDGIAMLRGWERSRGAVFEHFIATQLKMHVLLLTGDDPWVDKPEDIRPPMRTISTKNWAFVG